MHQISRVPFPVTLPHQRRRESIRAKGDYRCADTHTHTTTETQSQVLVSLLVCDWFDTVVSAKSRVMAPMLWWVIGKLLL